MESSRLLETFEQVLGSIDAEAANAYEQALPTLVEAVNTTMEEREDLDDLIGPNTSDVMESNHTNHGNFVLSQLRVRSARTLLEIASWAYQSYIKRGFSPSYFPIAMQAWQNAISQHIDERNAALLNTLYQAIIDGHQDLLIASQQSGETMQVHENIYPFFKEYLTALLEPDSLRATHITRSYIQGVEQIPTWWEQVIWPAMHEVGRLWSDGIITVGQEHIATSITQRIMSIYYPMILELPRDKGAIVVTASPGELHEIGARMVADFLELHGWDVYYTGADTPQESIVSLLENLHARVLCISTTMPYNLMYVSSIVERVRNGHRPGPIYVVVGGQAYKSDVRAWQAVGADRYISSASEAVQFLDSFLLHNH